MKVYRCLYEKDEINLFENGILSLTTNFNDYSDITLNTHDYGKDDNGFNKKLKKERMHFFLFKEDAIQFINNYVGLDCVIAECEIPDYLVIPNIGVGIYTHNENKTVMETAIPFGDLLRDINYEHYLAYYDMYRYNLLNIKYLNQKIELEKKLNLDKMPLKFIKCNYPIKLISSDEIESSLYYELFIIEKEYKNIFKLLGLKAEKKDNGQLEFKKISEPNLKEIRKILIEYNLIEEKTYQKTK